jgi:hypothetical protein
MLGEKACDGEASGKSEAHSVAAGLDGALFDD